MMKGFFNNFFKTGDSDRHLIGFQDLNLPQSQSIKVVRLIPRVYKTIEKSLSTKFLIERPKVQHIFAETE